jgi:hypothetical protein
MRATGPTILSTNANSLEKNSPCVAAPEKRRVDHYRPTAAGTIAHLALTHVHTTGCESSPTLQISAIYANAVNRQNTASLGIDFG